MPPRLTSLTMLVLVLAASGGAQAIGFGRAPAAQALGSPLNFPLQVRLEPDEVLEPGCVAAEVHYGERRLQPFNVQVRLEPGVDASERIVRVSSPQAIDEPVVTVSVTAGCVARATRRITVFADPPLGLPAAPPQALAAADNATDGSPPGTAASATAAAPGGSAVAAGSAPAAGNLSGGSSAATPARPSPARTASDSTAPPDQPRGDRVRTPRKPPRERAAAAPRPPRQALPRALAAARPSTAPAVAASAPAARLRLEAPDVGALPAVAAASAAQDALSAAMRAASAADTVAAAASGRIRTLEGQLDKVLAESRRQGEQIEALRQQVGASQGARDLVPWLGALLAVLAAACVWLALQLRRLKGEREASWWSDASAPAQQSQAPPPQEVSVAPVNAAPARATAPPAEPPASLPDTLAQPVSVAPPTLPVSAITAPMPREVSVEELIDLEQQAEFFIVLGQDESAIDLLVSHIRSTGGTSPLPYLKLLEIHRRRDEREAYERTRARFNHRFNAYAPDWDADMQHGRPLEDYPQVLKRLQQAWPRPMDAMAQLETLLFRTDGGELFELPAYRDVLMLYALARDLIDQQSAGAPTASIDVLLPLGEFQNFESTTPRPHLTLDRAAAVPDPIAALPQGGPTADVDLDLSEPAGFTRDVTAPGVFQDSAYSDSDFVDLDRFGTRPGQGRPSK